jgi:Ni,Fe-hydrogenase I cytochrome b subunit
MFCQAFVIGVRRIIKTLNPLHTNRLRNCTAIRFKNRTHVDGPLRSLHKLFEYLFTDAFLMLYYLSLLFDHDHQRMVALHLFHRFGIGFCIWKQLRFYFSPLLPGLAESRYDHIRTQGIGILPRLCFFFVLGNVADVSVVQELVVELGPDSPRF